MKTQHKWTPEQADCIEALSVFARGYHHLKCLKPFEGGVSVLNYGELSTYDGDELTRLVLVAHKYAVRISIQQGGPGSVKITAFKRKHGSIDELKYHQRHPGLSDLISEATKWRDAE